MALGHMQAAEDDNRCRRTRAFLWVDRCRRESVPGLQTGEEGRGSLSNLSRQEHIWNLVVQLVGQDLLVPLHAVSLGEFLHLLPSAGRAEVPPGQYVRLVGEQAGWCAGEDEFQVWLLHHPPAAGFRPDEQPSPAPWVSMTQSQNVRSWWFSGRRNHDGVSGISNPGASSCRRGDRRPSMRSGGRRSEGEHRPARSTRHSASSRSNDPSETPVPDRHDAAGQRCRPTVRDVEGQDFRRRSGHAATRS